MLDNRSSISRGRLHLSFPLGDKWIAYAYIRKNACSAFKVAMGFPYDTDIGRIALRFRYDRKREHDAVVFVYRDPVERMVSLFQNKILERVNSKEMIRRYVKVMGEGPSTFERFVDFCLLGRDPHCYTQKSHLKPIHYTHAISIADLHATMAGIVGEAAAAPFRRRVNQAEAETVEVSEMAEAKIRQFYAEDFRLLSICEAVRQRNLDQGPL